MEEHFLKWINIVDFKCFHEFEVNNLRRVNLIGGKNNIGKTAFLEACYIHAFTKNVASFAASLAHIKVARENINILNEVISTNKKFNPKEYLESTKYYSTTSNNQKIKFQFSNKDGIKEYLFMINENEKIINANDFSIEYVGSNVDYIDNFGFSDQELIANYIAIQEQDKENELNNLINNFDPKIEFFKVIGDKPKCKINDEYIDLTEFGDGLKHFISIICALYGSKNGQLFIDEIDNGIHYAQIKNIWKLIFQISKDVNCQVFATTHSKECIEAFNEVNCEDAGVYLEFYQSKKTNQINVKQRNKEQLEYSLSHNGEFRGE
ncbi:MAG: AAA family ATPase [Sulfuricurvum sp.]|jgi:AAA15 family ATPase/GTPase|uniref:AAA family ATPase n=1 Tax=Sulfuricurvum sp. TaxID=2025608 RepID=UPI0025DC5DA5|nr:AAA family ATPase [Sulfuricurvum sp.]MCK9373662.1 AAA family ATPase [Sulfuricurvum sp.]